MARTRHSRIGQYQLTARTDAPDFRDFTYHPSLARLKPRIAAPPDLNIRDQGPEGACTGFGLAAVIDRLARGSGRKIKGQNLTVSALMLYEMARRYDEWGGEDYQGSSCRGAIKGWYNMGVCQEALYPHDRSINQGFTVQAAKDARNNAVGAYYRLGNRISDYHAALNETGAVYCSAEVHEGWDRADPESGLIPLGKRGLGGHAFAIVGYDTRGFWIQNSWGRDWGRNGTALWLYEDWLLNIQDAWVFSMALPTPQIWHLPAKSNNRNTSAGKRPAPARAEIAGHFVHFDDGQFHDRGRYWSNADDVRLTAELVAQSDDYDHLLFYAHGGLNSPEDSARRIAAMTETFKANRIYPYHLMYDTGLLEELKDIVTGHRKQADERAGGFADWLDVLVEKTTRVPGRALWREMKSGARLPFEDGRAGEQSLAIFLEAFARSGKPKKLHLAGHSTGMILLAHLLQCLSNLAPRAAIETVSLMAPAGTLDLFSSHMQPLLKALRPAFRITEMAIYNLCETLERADEVTMAYNKSLLYLVSRSFEESVPARILGMEAYSSLIERRKLPRLSVYYSKGAVPGARITSSETHGGFDNDPLTMNHVLQRVLKGTPAREFTREQLEY
jgi:hypothetical protein